MVGIFSRISGSQRGINGQQQQQQQRSHSSLDERQSSGGVDGGGGGGVVVYGHGGSWGGVVGEFKPIEHPMEPDNDGDLPVKCPMPEPSILNDGRVWKERLVEEMRRKGETPVASDGAPLPPLPRTTHKRQQTASRERTILPSFSAPEQNIIKMLQECEEFEP